MTNASNQDNAVRPLDHRGRGTRGDPCADRTSAEARTRESWRDVAARVVAEFGGLIVWSPKPLNIGAVIRGISTRPLCDETTADQPFVVIGEATKDQWLRQLSFVGSDARFSRGKYYYFVQTD